MSKKRKALKWVKEEIDHFAKFNHPTTSCVDSRYSFVCGALDTLEVLGILSVKKSARLKGKALRIYIDVLNKLADDEGEVRDDVY